MRSLSKSISILLFSSLPLATTVHGVMIEVLQGGVSLGTFTPYTGVASAAANYNYYSSAAHLSVGPGQVSNEEQIFFYVDGSGNLAFNTVFRTGTGTTRNMTWNIAVDSIGDQTVQVTDDAGELKELAGGPGTTENFLGKWAWLIGYTDGGVIGDLSGDWQITITPTAYGGGVGTEDIQVYDASGSSIGLAKNTSQTIVFRPVPDAGTTAALLGLGLVGLLGVRRSRRSVV
ncbi:MAG: VPDSG-CTERM sorting domain-containing protein [Verrucomicrobiales bacterium]|nr:VPDSG-CTERM sorting domain-containing protein [Verrucomicrobiales bacterium]